MEEKLHLDIFGAALATISVVAMAPAIGTFASFESGDLDHEHTPEELKFYEERSMDREMIAHRHSMVATKPSHLFCRMCFSKTVPLLVAMTG